MAQRLLSLMARGRKQPYNMYGSGSIKGAGQVLFGYFLELRDSILVFSNVILIERIGGFDPLP